MIISSTDLNNPFYELYVEMFSHQRQHNMQFSSYIDHYKPINYGCTACLVEGKSELSDVRRSFSWAVPDTQAIDLIVEHAPEGVVEIGAGYGYWAWLLEQRKLRVHAYDIAPQNNHWCEDGESWTEVLHAGPEAASWHPDLALMLCWPPYDDPMAYHALSCYAGDTLIYIGEENMGCTADPQFFAALGEIEVPCRSCKESRYNWRDSVLDEWCDSALTGRCSDFGEGEVPHQGWSEVAIYTLPQWAGLHDRLRIYRR